MLPMIISIRIPHMLHQEGKLFESLGCLVLVRRDCIGSSKFTEERVFCVVDLEHCFGRKRRGFFLIIKLSAKVVQYNLISKTLREIYDMGSNEIADDYLHGFIPPYAMHAFDYVYNPSINMLKILPDPDYANVDSNVYGCAGLRLALDPTKSPYYKVVRAGRTSYWNNALHWLETENSQLTHYKLNIKYPDHPIITITQIPHTLHLEGKIFDSRGCLLLVRRDDFGSSEFTIYEMMKGSSVWSVRYHVDTDDFMTLLPEGRSIRSTVWSIILREREDDSFLVINLSGKLFISLGFIPPFAMYDMRPKQVDHKVYEFIPSYGDRILQVVSELRFSTTKVLGVEVFDVKGQQVSTGGTARIIPFEVEPQENVDQGAGLQEVQTQDLMDYQLARDREQHLACELFGVIAGDSMMVLLQLLLMSTLVFVDLEISTKSPHTVSPPTSLPDSTPPTLVPILRMTICMVVRVPPAMSPGLSASVAKVAAMSDSVFHKRFRSSYESSPSSLLPDLPSWKRYQGTSELVEDDKEEEDDEEEDEEIEESLDSDSESDDAEDEGPTTEDEDLGAGDEGLAVRDKGPGMRVESLSLGGDEAIPKGQQRAAPVLETAIDLYQSLRDQRVSAHRQPTLTTWIDPEDGITYIDDPAYPQPAPPAQTSPSPEWSSGSLPVSTTPSIIPSPISSPMIPLTVPSPIASPVTAETEGFLTELGARVKM
ncbi:hypothetical protein Tco_0323687 [Tanacetum coccineum]